MKKFKTTEFIDFAGKSHVITACALFEKSPYMVCNNEYEWEANAYVAVGMSIQNPGDEIDTTIAEKIAESRAEKGDFVLFATKVGLIGDTLVDALLDQELNFAKANPGTLIGGYHEMKAAYDKKQTLKDEIAGMTTTEKLVVSAIKEGVDIDKCVRLAKA